jgi:hypothetical protein
MAFSIEKEGEIGYRHQSNADRENRKQSYSREVGNGMQGATL